MSGTQYSNAGVINKSILLVSWAVALDFTNNYIRTTADSTLTLPTSAWYNIGFELTVFIPSIMNLVINASWSDLINWQASFSTNSPGLVTLKLSDLNVWDLQFTSNESWAGSSGTHSVLNSLVSSSSIIPWEKYLMTDFATTYIEPFDNSLFVASTEQLVLTGKTVNSFEPIAYSVNYPKDVVYYDINPVSLNVPLYAYQEWTGSSVNSEDLGNVQSITYATTGFTIQLNAPLVTDSFTEFYFENIATGDYWELLDTIDQLIINWDISVLDNWGNNYTFTILALDLNNSNTFDFADIVANWYDYYGLFTWQSTYGTNKGRIYERYDSEKNNRWRVDINDSLSDTADFRWSERKRASADPTWDYPFLPVVYWSGSLVDLVEEVTGSWGIDTRTIVVDDLDTQLIPVFGEYSNTQNVDIIIGILSSDTTFGQAVDGYISQASSVWFTHYAADVTDFKADKYSQHWGLYFGQVNGTRLWFFGALYGEFFASSLNNTEINYGTMRNCISGSNTWYNIRINNAVLINHVLELNINEYEFDNGTFIAFKFEAPSGSLFRYKMDGNLSVISNCYHYTDGSFTNNTFNIGRPLVSCGWWNVYDGMANCDVTVTDGISTTDFSQLNGLKWNFKQIINNAFIWPIEGMEWFGWTIQAVIADNPWITNIEVHRDLLTAVIDWELTNVKFMMDWKNSDITQSVENCIVECEVDGHGVTIASGPILNENIIGESPDGKLWKASYAPVTGALITTEVL